MDLCFHTQYFLSIILYNNDLNTKNPLQVKISHLYNLEIFDTKGILVPVWL
jgi:hypothetical protein